MVQRTARDPRLPNQQDQAELSEKDTTQTLQISLASLDQMMVNDLIMELKAWSTAL